LHPRRVHACHPEVKGRLASDKLIKSLDPHRPHAAPDMLLDRTFAQIERRG